MMSTDWKRFCISLLFLGSILSISAQDFTQSVRGQVVDRDQGHPLTGATLEIVGTDFQTETDSKGNFRFTAVPAGRHTLEIRKTGYQTYVLPDMVVNAGKETVLEISLETRFYTTEEVQIQANIDRDLNRVSTRLFTVEESKRFAAVYFDPARMAASFPGVVQDNDQANHLIVRGNSPNGLLWRLEGVDIVNPNHTPNAGTFSDRLTQSGGGTIMLSTQLLANSSFSSGAFTPEFGNALSGIFDIHFRKGNNERYEFTGQAGLIGVDLAAEGPINRKKGSSFLANYRYSTVGLLSLMNIPLGDEIITYQDLAFNLNFPTERAGTFSLFGLLGNSSNTFEGPREDSLITEQKDRFDIFFRSRMGASGITHQLLLGDNTILRSVLAVSALAGSRNTAFLDQNFETSPVEDDELQQQKLSFTTSVSHKFNQRVSLKGGLFLNRIGYVLNSVFQSPTGGRPQVLASGQGSAWLIQPYVDLKLRLTPGLNLQGGLHGMYFFLNDSKVLEPRLALNWSFAKQHRFRLAYGLHSQMQLPGTYFAAFPGPNDLPLTPNRDLDFTRAHHFAFNYQNQISSYWLIRVEPYFQQLFQVPVSQDPSQMFSALNLLEGYVDQELVNEGEGRNYGVELTVEKLLHKNYYFLFSGSLYESLYRLPNTEYLPSRFAGNYALSGSGGWEREGFNKKGHQRITGLNLRMIYRGGLRGMPIDLDASRQAMRTIFDESAGFTERFPNYFRLDLRFTLKRNRARFTRTLGIDIQNALNTQNVAHQYYDFQLDQILTRTQLGIIPLLSYRLEF